jgi:bifunctional DNA-binding transcriptional regulator/antitoxin component of YhaV-PrlF toxin-antitoxin module
MDYKTKTWVLPVEADPSGEYFLTFPEDLLEAADLKEGDEIEWVDNGDGVYVFKKATTPETGITTTPRSPTIP